MFFVVGWYFVVGLLVVIVGVGCGFIVNLLIVIIDVLFFGISIEVVKFIDVFLYVSVIDNWYFMVILVIVLMFVGGLIIDKLVELWLGQW